MNELLEYRANRASVHDDLDEPEGVSDIGVLDIFGFENFAHNSFEQLCINTANEQLHHFFNQHIFAWELEEYKKEGIAATDITFEDNKDKITLLLGRPIGVFSILDEQAKLGRSTDKSYLEAVKKNCGQMSGFIKVAKGGEHAFGDLNEASY